MFNWFKNLFKKEESSNLAEWRTQDSILSFLRKHLTKEGLLDESAYELPDEVVKEDGIKFAPGLMDTLVGADNSETSAERIDHLIRLLTSIAQFGDEQSKATFYKDVTENNSVIGIIDQFLEKLLQTSLPVEPYLFDFTYDLVAKTNHRNSVKFGIAIIGLCQKEEPIDDLKVLALHDEFTVYATLALRNLSKHIVQDLWTLAQKLDGWGKIQIVDRIVEMELTDEIRDWLVYKGYKNNIMYQYLALKCAVHGRLKDKLSVEQIDDDLFIAARELIEALMDEGPVAGMSGYTDSAETIEHFLRHAETHDLKIADFLLLHNLKEYFEKEQAKTERRALKNWTQDDFADRLIDTTKLLQSKDWVPEAREALKHEEAYEFWQGKEAAQKLGIDIWQVLWERLDITPFESTSWYDVISNMKPGYTEKFVEKAEQLLPLDELTTGPKDEMGFGPNFQKHRSLECVITFLADYPGLGEKLILAGLKSPNIRNRIATLKTLEKWTLGKLSNKVKAEVHNLKEIESDQQVSELIEDLLNPSSSTSFQFPDND